MARIIIILMLLALFLVSCSSSHTWDEFTDNECRILHQNAYVDIGSGRWWVHGLAEKHLYLQTGKYRIDITKSRYDPHKPYRVHVWLWPYCAANHLEVYDCWYYYSLDDALAAADRQIQEIEATFISRGVIRCYHPYSKTIYGTVRWLTPAQWIAEHDSIERYRINRQIIDTRHRLDSLEAL